MRRFLAKWFVCLQNMFFWADPHSKLRVAGLIFALASCFACWGVSANDSKRVLLLNSFGREFKPWRDYIVAIRSELERRAPWRIEISDFSLVSALRRDENPEQYLVQYLDSLFSERPPDLIISVGAPAAAFVQRHRKSLFPTAPMLFTVVEQRRVKYTQLTDNDTVVAVAHDFPAIIENVLQLLPETERVLVVNGDSPLERFWQKDMQEDFEPFESKIEFIWTNEMSFDNVLKRAASLPPNSAIFWHLMSVDGAGVVHEGDSGLSKLHAVANAPIFSYADTFFGNGILGGPMHATAEGSNLAVTVAIRILGGEKPSDVSVPPTGFAAPIFDWRQLQRWQISESRLPKDSEVRFRVATAWDKYRTQIVVVAIIIVLQTLLILGLIAERRRRFTAETAARDRLAELTHMNRRAAAGIATASIAHEINQPLAAIVASGNAGVRWLADKRPNLGEVRAALDRIVKDGHRAAEIINSLRAMYKREEREERPLDLNTLIRHVQSFLASELERKEIQVKAVLTDDLPPVLGDRTQLEQVILNLIVNAVDAMEAVPPSRRLLSIRSEADLMGEVIVSVEDAGPGIEKKDFEHIFEPFFTTKPEGMGMGLAICHSILEAHGGKLTAERRAGHGTTFKITLPIARKA